MKHGILPVVPDQLARYMYRNQEFNSDDLGDGLLCSQIIKSVRIR